MLALCLSRFVHVTQHFTLVMNFVQQQLAMQKEKKLLSWMIEFLKTLVKILYCIFNKCFKFLQNFNNVMITNKIHKIMFDNVPFYYNDLVGL
jgi:hypothetical protein